MNNFIEDYYKNGYAVIDDFLPIDWNTIGVSVCLLTL